MLSSIIRFSIHYRGIVLFTTIVLIGYATYQLFRAGLDIFPEFSPKLIVLQTEAPGFSSEQVEVLVTQPIENALIGMIGLQTIRSESIQGLSIVNVFFEENTDVYRNRQLVSERLGIINNSMPDGVEAVTPAPMASSSATVMTIGVTSESRSLMELRSIIDTGLVPRILSTKGVADVNIFGGEVTQLQIKIKPDRLKLYSIGINEILQATKKATLIFGSGFIENTNQRLILSFDKPVVTPEEIGRIVLREEPDSILYIEDVADVSYGPEPPFGAATVMGEDGIVMMIIGQYGANTLTVTQNLEKLLQSYQDILADQGVVLHSRLFRPADYIETSLHNISSHLLVGGIFVVIVIFLFLYNIRTAFISVIAIPISLMSAALILIEMGINLNIMILGGLAIALGEVVDDAIIDTENIYRRLRLNRNLPNPEPVAKVVFDASLEVRGSVVYASFIVASAFIPLLTLSGVAGRLFSPLGLSYIIAILFSLLVALTVTPALCYVLLSSSKLDKNEPPVLQLIKPIYGGLVKLTCRFPYITILSSLALCIFGMQFLYGMGGNLLPKLREGHYIVHTTMQPGTSLDEAIRVGNRLTDAITDIDGVVSMSQWAGRAERSADTYGSHYSEYEVELEHMSGSEQQDVLDQIHDILRTMPGLLFEAHNFLSERIYETISGYNSPIVVNIYGNDLYTLDMKANEVVAVMQTIPGATGVRVRAVAGIPVMSIHLDTDELMQYGLRPVDVYEIVQLAYQGNIVGNYQQGSLIRDVTVLLDESRHTIGSLYHLPIKTPSGQMIELQDVARIQQTNGRYNILHQNAQRLQTVTCYVEDRDTVSFMNELRERVLSEVEFDSVTTPEFTGAAIEQAKAKEELIVHSLIVGALIFILIYMAIGSIRHMILTLVNLPFSLVGGVLAVYVTGASLSVGSLVGFVTLFGITVRNSLMLISHYNHLIQQEGLAWNMQTVIQGAQERLPSILMTALVTALAMLPIAIDSDNAGREIMGPMAAIIIGGLASSTLLNLLIMPSVLFRFGRFSK